MMNMPLTPIYIVDDNQSFGNSLKRMLNAREYNADYFESAQTFLDSIPSGQKGIVIVDLYMPECNGFELMKKMHAMGYDASVIVITGHSQANSRDKAMQRGAIGFLEKPFTERSLLELIQIRMENED